MATKRLSVVLATTAAAALMASCLSAQQLQYTSKVGQTFAYRVDITAERNDAVEFCAA